MKFSQRGGSLKGNGKGLLAGRETPKTPFRSLSKVKYAFSRRSSAVTAKKCTKKVCCACKVAFLLIRPIVVFHRSPALPSPLSITRFYILFEQTINIIESFAFSPG